MLRTESLMRVKLSLSPSGALASASGAQRIERRQEARVLALRSDGHAQKAGAPKRAAATHQHPTLAQARNHVGVRPLVRDPDPEEVRVA